MDWTLIDTLLSVIHQASAAGPKFQKWAVAAADELEKQWPQPEEPEVKEPEEGAFAPAGDEDSTPEDEPTKDEDTSSFNGRRV